ncbi:MAG: PHP domain-containing protein [Methanobacteriota archaeon]|nr:MAG: PHP domain-containing protein [Euryarchaeota archaeon]
MDRMDFHIHSEYSDDGSASLEDIVIEALRGGLVAIGVVDHARQDEGWLDEREKELSALRREYSQDIDLFSGVEISATEDQASPELDGDALNTVDYIVASFDQTPASIESKMALEGDAALVDWWSESMQKLLEGATGATVIGKPDRILTAKKVAVDSHRMDGLMEAALGSQMFVEWNPATSYPLQPFANDLGGRGAGRLIYASDARSVEELAEAIKGFTSFEAGIVERGNASFLEILRRRKQ